MNPPDRQPPPEAIAWLAQPELAELWTVVRARLERNGLQISGSIGLTGLDAPSREALSLLLGRRIGSPDTAVRLADLDTRLRAGAVGRGLADTVRLLGGPLTDRPAARSAAQARRTDLWASVSASLAASPLADEDWAHQWLADVRRTGTAARLPAEAAKDLLQQAIQLLGLLRAAGDPGPQFRGRGELATLVTGTAHGLDDDTLLSRLVLRGLALALGAPLPGDAAGRRDLWRLAAVAPDEVSSTVLTYGLRPVGDGWRERALRERADHHAETHLTLRDLRSLDLAVPACTRVHICENPQVVEAAAATGCGAGLVCTSGSAATVVLELLDALAAAGCEFAYHGDFDWPGIALANRIVQRYRARPWRMAASDYEHLAAHTRTQGSPPLPLSGTPVDALWDPGLRPAMAALDLALHEESALHLLLADLA
ncbi:TIGR02679 family protein [Kitasatospora sp. NPDC051853]|uniref:TIGR02679 family protein n=1 Tax=Kitasatospora sp. NPDC051853 TaxID=3364058 RepID=UPI00379A73E1